MWMITTDGGTSCPPGCRIARAGEGLLRDGTTHTGKSTRSRASGTVVLCGGAMRPAECGGSSSMLSSTVPTDIEVEVDTWTVAPPVQASSSRVETVTFAGVLRHDS